MIYLKTNKANGERSSLLIENPIVELMIGTAIAGTIILIAHSITKKKSLPMV